MPNSVNLTDKEWGEAVKRYEKARDELREMLRRLEGKG